ncbi:MAG: serine--tRNA ligase [Acidobacteriota bacterium]
MIDLRLLRSDPAQVRAALARRGDASVAALLEEILDLDARRRAFVTELDKLKAERNEASRADAQLVKQQGALPPDVVVQRRVLGERIAAAETDVRTLDGALADKTLYVPNIPLPDVPDGPASANVIVRSWGTPRPGAPDVKPHWEIGERLGLFDLARGAKLAGSGFPLFVGAGARLVRALLQFMLDLHTRQHGYIEVEPPFVVRREMMQGTGQLPKFAEDAYHTAEDDLFLVPTAEVPLTNLYRDEILDGARLPIAHTAYTPCWRREAGAAGKDTRGLLRVHQFDKVELVRFVRPADATAELEQLTRHAETVLQLLELPYRVVALAAGDLGFSAAKTYDLEAWAPGVGAWLEVSSASTFTDFQARRAGIRFRAAKGEKPEFVYTLNASGVALPRTIAALLETHQVSDGSVTLPQALVPYMGSERLALPPTAGA